MKLAIDTRQNRTYVTTFPLSLRGHYLRLKVKRKKMWGKVRHKSSVCCSLKTSLDVSFLCDWKSCRIYLPTRANFSPHIRHALAKSSRNWRVREVWWLHHSKRPSQPGLAVKPLSHGLHTISGHFAFSLLHISQPAEDCQCQKFSQNTYGFLKVKGDVWLAKYLFYLC